jgi:hypothetical protein
MDDDHIKDCGPTRRTKRSLVLLAARISTPNRTFDVRLRNLSQNGALLEGSHTLAVGTEVTFERGTTRVRARIAWSSPDRFGITFFVPIAESEVLVHVGQRKREPVTDRAPAFKRSGLHGVNLSPRERRIAEEWTRSQGRAYGE